MKRIILIIAVILLVGCKRKPILGVIVEKRFKPLQTTTTLLFTGKTCVPITKTNPAQWIVIVEDSTKERHIHYVTRSAYDSLKIGMRMEISIIPILE